MNMPYLATIERAIEITVKDVRNIEPGYTPHQYWFLLILWMRVFKLVSFDVAKNAIYALYR